jgi:DNA-binding NtrC family response regulator
MSDLLIGESPIMRRLRALVARVAASTLPLLIEGETGSGKELVARALHEWSGRPGRLVALNVCAVSDSMFEAAMFGHVRGAFTGALRDSAGYLTEAHRGTLFLDEVSGLSLGSQTKLLRAIETKEFRPVGGTGDQRSDFRLVAASNETVATLVQRGSFRRDLSHRLGGLCLTVPPLRDHTEDIPLLVRHFTTTAAAERKVDVVIGGGVIRLLQAYCWPGNVRQLRHVIEASLTLSPGFVTLHDVAALIQPNEDGAAGHRRAAKTDELLAVLERCAWDFDQVASELGVHRATVYRRLRRLEGSAQRNGARLGEQERGLVRSVT